MRDIVERLRKGTVTQPGNQHPTCDDVDAADALMAKAADEIILLRRQRDDAKDDYVRRHKDAVDRYLEVQELRTALSEAEQRKNDEWKPIETAPKDGSKVILFTVHPGDDFGEPFSKVQIGSWQEGNGLPIDHDFYREPEWETQWVGEPTHWRPLPSPPVLIPSEPHDSEGRETPRRGDPSIFDDAEGRN